MLSVKKIVIFCACVLCFAGVSAQSYEIYLSDTINRVDAEGQKYGLWIYFDAGNKTKIMRKGHYVSGQKEGVWDEYYPNGNVKTSITYRQNRQNGYAKIFYENGKLSEEGIWRGNRWTGQYKFYHQNGNPSYVWNFDDEGKRTGEQKYFYENGQLRIEGNWQEGKEQGVIKEYYVTGKLRAESEWKFGKTDGMVKEYYENGSLKAEKVFNDGVYDPNSSKLYANKTTQTVVEPVNQDTVKTVPVVDNGTELFTGTGFHRIYNSKKQLEQEGDFKSGVLYNGKRFYYNEKGEHTKTAIYQEGRIVEVKDAEKTKNE